MASADLPGEMRCGGTRVRKPYAPERMEPWRR
jgi:hypothetical protein